MALFGFAEKIRLISPFFGFSGYQLPENSMTWQSNTSLSSNNSGWCNPTDCFFNSRIVGGFSPTFTLPNVTLFPSRLTSIEDSFIRTQGVLPQSPSLSLSNTIGANFYKPKIEAPKIPSTLVDNSYRKYTNKHEAIAAAERDPNLERLSSGKGYSIVENMFVTDIPFAKKGTSKLLEKVSEIIGQDLKITSALGTGIKGNPHKVGSYASHHNAMNPKLDFDVANYKEALVLAEKLKATGLFSFVLAEKGHVDVQFSPEAYAQYA